MSNNAHDKKTQEARSADVFARLKEQDIEQFYAHYQLWMLRRRVPLLEKQAEALREHLAENQHTLEALRPSALAQAVLVRLQSNGVSDTDVLDLMLEQGEDWLDRMMQRLDYCEQVQDFIQGDYTQWCIRSLEGAYDWIDSLLGSIKENNGHEESSASDTLATEELLLQRLSLDDEEALLEVKPQQPSPQPKLSTTGTPETSVEYQPSNEAELPTLSGQARTEFESEPLLLSDEVAEQPESSAEEPQPELFGWKDLEDLEAPDGHPAPWYSVDLTENGASSTSTDAGQANSANDWISVLQADNEVCLEANEHTTFAGTEEPLPASHQEEDTEIHPPALISQTAGAETVISEAESALIFPAEVATDTEPVDEAHATMPGKETLDEAEIMQHQVEPELQEWQGEKDSAHVEEVVAIIDGGEESNEEPGAIEKATLAVYEPVENEDLKVSVEEVDEQSENSALLVPEGKVDEQSESAPLEASTRHIEEQAESTVLEMPQQHNDALQVDESQAEENRAVQSLEIESNTTGEGNEIESAAVLNDILSIEGEQEEQMAWYEYLELDEPANGVTHAEGIELSELANDTPLRSADEQSTLNGAGSTEPEIDLLAGETNVPEIYEYTAAEENIRERTESDLEESVIAEGAGEIEGWQTWQAQKIEDETLPLALKDIQSAQQLQEDAMQEAASAESGEEPELVLEKVIEGERSDKTEEEVRLDELVGANTVEMSVVLEGEAGGYVGEALVVPALPVDELSMMDTVEQIAVTATEISSPIDTQASDELSMMDTVEQIAVTTTETSSSIGPQASDEHESKGIPFAQVGTGNAFAPTTTATTEESTLMLAYQHTGSHENREETPARPIVEHPQIEPLAGPPKEAAPAPKKLGFWRRLFRFGRKKR